MRVGHRKLAAFAGHYLRWLGGRSALPKEAPRHSNSEHDLVVARLSHTLQKGSPPFRQYRRGVGHQARHLGPGSSETILDLRPLDGILELDSASKTIKVEPLVTMRQLLRATQPIGLMPTVIPEFPDITVGGAIQGLAAESTSHRQGLFHESLVAMEVLLGDGTLVQVTAAQHPELWFGLPGSYGTLGVLVAATLRLMPARPWVRLQHRRRPLAAFLETAFDRSHDAIDAISIDDNHVVETVADWVETPESTAQRVRFRGADIYYCDHLMSVTEGCGPEYLSLEEYAFRYDRGAFWIGPTKLGRSLPSRLLFARFASAANLYRLRRSRQDIDPTPSRRLVQDCIVPAKRAAELVTWLRQELEGPLWLLPITAGTDNLFGLRPGQWLNVGIYLRSKRPAQDVAAYNRELERTVAALGGVKTLHADLYCTRHELASIYDLDRYEELRKTLVADRAFPHLFDKLGLLDRND